MALDPNLAQDIDPNAWAVLVDIDSRLDAIQVPAPNPVVEITLTFQDGSTQTFPLAP